MPIFWELLWLVFFSTEALQTCKERIEVIANTLGLEGFSRIDAFVNVRSGEVSRLLWSLSFSFHHVFTVFYTSYLPVQLRMLGTPLHFLMGHKRCTTPQLLYAQSHWPNLYRNLRCGGAFCWWANKTRNNESFRTGTIYKSNKTLPNPISFT